MPEIECKGCRRYVGELKRISFWTMDKEALEFHRCWDCFEIAMSRLIPGNNDIAKTTGNPGGL
jgi:hypothetical protein